MKNLMLSLLLLMGSLSFGQVPEEGTTYSSTLKMGDLIQFEGKAVKFKELLSDSRCPEGVTCVWAGEAKLLFEVYESGKLCGEKVLVLSGGPEVSSLKGFFEGADFSLSAFSLRPYPEIGSKIEVSEYRLDVAVQRGEE